MGTLHKQLARREHEIRIDEEIDDFEIVEKHLAYDPERIKSFVEFYKAKQIQRLGNIMVDNGDAWDEQIAGIGQILENIGLEQPSAIREIADAISNKDIG